MALITEKLRSTLLKDREGLALPSAIRWALHDQAKLDKLVTKNTVLVESIEALFPSLKLELDLLAAQQAELLLQQVKEPAETVQQVVRVVEEVDERLTGHTYKNLKASGSATITAADYVSEEAARAGWTASRGGQHSYDGVTGSGQSRIFLGNITGGPSPLDRPQAHHMIVKVSVIDGL